MDTYIIIIIICCLYVSSSSSALFILQSSSGASSSKSSNASPSTNSSEDRAVDRAAADRTAADRRAADDRKAADDRAAAERKAAADKAAAERKAAADKAAADKALAEKIARAEKEDKQKFIDILTKNLESEKEFLNAIITHEAAIGNFGHLQQFCAENGAFNAFVPQCRVIQQERNAIADLGKKKGELYKKFENENQTQMKKYNLKFPENMIKDELLFEKFISEVKK